MPRKKTVAPKPPVKHARATRKKATQKPSTRIELAAIAGNIPAENLQQMVTAIQSGKWLFAVWHISEGQIRLERTAANFPTIDLDKCVEMLKENLMELQSQKGDA